VTNVGATVTGRVVIEGPAIAPPVTGETQARPPVMVFARSLETNVVVGAGEVVAQTPGADLTFEMKGLRGRVAPAVVRPGAVLKSVTVGGDDITTTGLTLDGTERIDGLTITLTTETATIAGTVTDTSGQPQEAWVIVFPEDQSKWGPGSPFVSVVRTTTSETPVTRRGTNIPLVPQTGSRTPTVTVRDTPAGRAGGFESGPLVPGRYLVAALPWGDPSSPAPYMTPPTDPESLAALRASARVVAATASQPAVVDLKLSR